MAMRDLFQVVYDLKKKDVEKNKQYSFDSSGNKTVKNKILVLKTNINGFCFRMVYSI